MVVIFEGSLCSELDLLFIWNLKKENNWKPILLRYFCSNLLVIRVYWHSIWACRSSKKQYESSQVQCQRQIEFSCLWRQHHGLQEWIWHEESYAFQQVFIVGLRDWPLEKKWQSRYMETINSALTTENMTTVQHYKKKSIANKRWNV